MTYLAIQQKIPVTDAIDRKNGRNNGRETVICEDSAKIMKSIK